MKLSNCRGCGKLHVQHENVLCSDCFKLNIEQTNQIKSFLRANPGASIVDLVRETGFSISKVNELVGK